MLCISGEGERLVTCTAALVRVPLILTTDSTRTVSSKVLSVSNNSQRTVID